jgi:hypothetical protein
MIITKKSSIDMNTKVKSKNSILTDTLVDIFEKKVNLARIKFISLFILALSKVQTVGFEKLAIAFEDKSKTESSLRRIQRFIAKYTLDIDLIAKLIFSLLPEKPPYRLALDRTNWKFGSKNINILVLSVVYQGVSFPLIFSMMDKFGNSSTQERIDLIERYIKLFGTSSIDCLLADREFIGEQWIGFLNNNKIRYYIRIKENFKVYIPRNGHIVKASWLFNSLKLNQFLYYRRIVKVNNQLCYISGSKVLNKKGAVEFQIIISFNKPEKADKLYKQRWQIETAFKALKTSGFNIEDTHLTKLDRVEKLFALVLIAFTWAYKIGIELNRLRPIKIKKHGRRAYSFFKYGLNILAKVLNNNDLAKFNYYVNFLSCT